MATLATFGTLKRGTTKTTWKAPFEHCTTKQAGIVAGGMLTYRDPSNHDREIVREVIEVYPHSVTTGETDTEFGHSVGMPLIVNYKPPTKA